jgi:hypothetical protein
MTLFLLSIPYMSWHSVFSDDFKFYRVSFRWRFMDQPWHSVFDNSMHPSWLYVSIDSICQLSLSFQGWFLGLQRLSFRSWFMDQYWHNVFDNSMRQPWLYFCYRFDVSVMKSFTLLFPYVSYHSVFSDEFNVYRTQFSLTIYRSAMT